MNDEGKICSKQCSETGSEVLFDHCVRTVGLQIITIHPEPFLQVLVQAKLSAPGGRTSLLFTKLISSHWLKNTTLM
ncbi:hypothetical protein E2C01_067499 [Portunus trituberculatus]|uniref:Uncharacterized protein n=1 Tax=Portunus trituberculatus TaxID=210409 RepID=A0A5B7HJY9_PORTR|nr:hypothetical protein [Portunus trituberculatus]